MKRAALYLALTPVIAGPAVAAFADTVTTPAPPSASSATAAGVAGVVAIGHTSASAGPGSTGATANALELGGKPLSQQTGGSASAGQSKKGSLLDTGTTPLGRLMVTPWHASASSDHTVSHGDAALARLTVVNPQTAQVNVLQSQSDAHYAPDGSTSTSSSSSDGATVNLGNGALMLDLLHAESASGQKGSSYLVGINGQQIGTSSQANNACTITIPQVLTLNCLTATGGVGSTTSGAQVGSATLAGGQLPGGVISGVSAKGAPTTAPAGATHVLGERYPAAAAPAAATSSNGSLPFTGLDTGLYAAAAAALLFVGGALLRVTRRRRAAA